jgi:hypothetical protein
LSGPDPSAEEIYQHQVALWLQQNQHQHQGGGNNHGHQHGHHQANLNNIAIPELFVQRAVAEEEAPPLFNFQEMLAEQGVPYEAGLPPPANNITDSPLQAWTDSILDSPTSSYSSLDTVMTEAQPEQQINFFRFDSGTLHDLHAKLWTKLNQAKSAMIAALAPNVALDNSQHISFSIHMD